MSDELKACPFCGGSASVAEVDCEDFVKYIKVNTTLDAKFLNEITIY